MNKRRNRGGAMSRIAQHVSICVCVEPFEELVVNSCLHQQPRASKTHLTRVIEHHRGLLGGKIEISIVEHNERAFTTELCSERNEILGRRNSDDLARFRRAGEADSAHRGVVHQRRANLFANALHHVEHPWRHASPHTQIGKQRHRQR